MAKYWALISFGKLRHVENCSSIRVIGEKLPLSIRFHLNSRKRTLIQKIEQKQRKKCSLLGCASKSCRHFWCYRFGMFCFQTYGNHGMFCFLDCACLIWKARNRWCVLSYRFGMLRFLNLVRLVSNVRNHRQFWL